MMRRSRFDQPIGAPLGAWKPPPFPPAQSLPGAHVDLVPLDAELHSEALFSSLSDGDDSLWAYMPWGPFSSTSELEANIAGMLETPDQQPFAVVVKGEPLGYLTYLRIAANAGTIEIGGIALSPRLQQTIASTEAQYLPMKNAFDLGYRRYEWKCDALNGPSRAAADRLGFTYEGPSAKRLTTKDAIETPPGLRSSTLTGRP